jgi:hypothetical protein
MPFSKFLIPNDYRKMLTEDNPSAKKSIESVLQNLHLQDRYFLKKKKIGVKTVYTLNVNMAGDHRLIFESVQISADNTEAYFLRGIVINHDYHKALRWEPFKILEAMPADYMHSEHLYDVDLDLQSEFWHDGCFIIPSDRQRAVVASPTFPKLIMGPPGSGKSLVSLAFLQEQALKHVASDSQQVIQLLYLSKQQILNNQIARAWDDWAKLFLSESDASRVNFECKNFTSLAYENTDKVVVTKDELLAIIERYIDCCNIKYNNKQSQLSAQKIFDEFILSSYILNYDIERQNSFEDSSYKILGIKQISVVISEKEFIYSAYNNLLNKLGNRVYPGITAINLPYEVYDYTCCDEVQSVSMQDLLHALRVTKQAQIVYCGDSYQRGDLKVSTFSLLAPFLHSMFNITLVCETLEETYRLNPEVAQLCSQVVSLMNYLGEGKAEKSAYSSIKSSALENPGSVNWLDVLDTSGWDSLGIDANVAAVVLSFPDAEKIRALGWPATILEINQARGLQFSKVLVYLSAETLLRFKSISQSIPQNVTSTLRVFEHGAKSKDVMQADLGLEILSDLMTALSRSCGDIWVHCEKCSKHHLGNFIDWFKKNCHGTEIMLGQKSSDVEWFKMIHNLIKNDVTTQALGHLQRHFNLDLVSAQKYLEQFRVDDGFNLPYGLNLSQDKKNIHKETSASSGLPALPQSIASVKCIEPSGVVTRVLQPSKKKQQNQPSTQTVEIPTFIQELEHNKGQISNVNFLVDSLLQENEAKEWLLYALPNKKTVFESLFSSYKQVIALALYFLNDTKKMRYFTKLIKPFLQNNISDGSKSYSQLILESSPSKGNFTIYADFIIELLNAMPLDKIQDSSTDLTKVLYWLFSMPNLLLNNNWDNLKKCISANSLNAKITTEGPDKGKTLLYALCDDKDGTGLLQKKWKYLKKFFIADSFNQVVTAEGDEKGITPLFCLCGNEQGRTLLESHWDDIKNLLTKEGLNQVVTAEDFNKGKTPLYMLCNYKQGLELLESHWDDIKGLLTQEGLNQVVTAEGLEQGKTPLYMLCGRNHGLTLLEAHWGDIKDLLTQEGLNQFVTAEGPHQGKTLLLWLGNSENHTISLKSFTNYYFTIQALLAIFVAILSLGVLSGCYYLSNREKISFFINNNKPDDTKTIYYDCALL